MTPSSASTLPGRCRGSKDLFELFECKVGLPQNRTYYPRAQVTRMHRDGYMQVAALELQVASRLADFIEAKTLQRRNKPSGRDSAEVPHAHLIGRNMPPLSTPLATHRVAAHKTGGERGEQVRPTRVH